MTELTTVNEATAQPVDPMVNMIERLVLDPNADLDKLERMLSLKRDHDRDNARVSFSRALSAARAEIPPIVKDATVDFKTSKGRTNYRHETLAGIAKVIDPILSRFGLSYRFRTDQGGGGVKVTCIIAHAEGHNEETSLMCAPDGSGSKNPFQAVGSAVTYLQRYTLKAALGLSAEIDDDGQGSAPRPSQGQTAPPRQTPRNIADVLTSEIRKRKGDRASLSELWKAQKQTLSDLPDELFNEMRGEFEAAMPAIAVPTKDINPDEIPY